MYWMAVGSPKVEPGREKDEDQVEVTLTKGFWLGKYEVTQGEWQSMTGTTGREQAVKYMGPAAESGIGPRQPIYSVSYDEATEFCAKLIASERRAGRLPAGWVYRLPSEAEWEYACRAGTTTATAFGNSLSSTQANFNGKSPYNGAAEGVYRGTVEVGSLNKPNAWGLMDMHGNVCEWCADWYVAKLRGGRDPFQNYGPSNPNNSDWIPRVSRGGGFSFDGKECRSAQRRSANGGFVSGGPYHFARSFEGFRVAVGPELK